MKTDNNFVRSGHTRIAEDNYQTVDPRCVQALVETLNLGGECVDVCSPNGSGIVSELVKMGYSARGIDNAFVDFVSADNVISNPPYARSIVDKIIYRQLQRLVDGDCQLVAMLLRTQFDHAKTRAPMFKNNSRYAGQIKMTFRPIWFLDTDTTPIHNYVWHIWANKWNNRPPHVWYW